MQQGQMNYDRAITVFSPDGRLFQVEYAREAVKKGSTALGLKFSNGVLLISDRKVRSRLVEQNSVEKIQLIDDYVAAVTSGLVADARVLIDFSRVAAQQEKVTYGGLINMENLVRKVADQMQQYTQYGGVRPYGVSLIYAGVDRVGPRLFDCDPAGTINEYKAVAVGSGKDQVVAYLEKEYKEDLKEKEAVALGIAALKVALEEEGGVKSPEIATITVGNKYYFYTKEEAAKFTS